MLVDPNRFRFWHPVDVRFKDIDLEGHAHHSLALVYFEEAREAYWRKVVGRGDREHVEYILAEAQVRYHARVTHPLRMEVGVRVSTLGKKHFVMEYLAVADGGAELLSGQTTMVWYDCAEGRTGRIAPEARRAMESFEGMGGG